MAKKIDLDGLEHFKQKENASIAGIESSSTASKAYKVGQYFYFKGTLVVCTVDIPSGGTITLNTNCKAVPLADEVSDLKTALGDLNNLTTTAKNNLVAAINEAASSGGSGLTNEAKTALLNCFQHIAWADENGSTYYTALQTALTPSENWSITNVLTHVTNSNANTTVAKNASYSATLTAGEGYNISSVTVTMGGTDVTSSVYSNGTITIASVTGNVVITAVAIMDTTVTYTYTNYARNLTSPFDVTSRTGFGVTTPFSAASGEDITFYITNPNSVTLGGYQKLFALNSESTPIGYTSILAEDIGTVTTRSMKSSNEVAYGQFIIPMGGETDSYAYHTSSGDIIFAGSNSPYYGMTNISEAT